MLPSRAFGGVRSILAAASSRASSVLDSDCAGGNGGHSREEGKLAPAIALASSVDEALGAAGATWNAFGVAANAPEPVPWKISMRSAGS